MAKKQKATRARRRVRKNIEKGEAHIASTFNNTMVTLTDINGNVISWASAGQLGLEVQENLLLLQHKRQHKKQLKKLKNTD